MRHYYVFLQNKSWFHRRTSHAVRSQEAALIVHPHSTTLDLDCWLPYSYNFYDGWEGDYCSGDVIV